jgi:hypothetical protein
VCGDVGREVIRLTHFQGQSQGQGPYLLLTPYTHGVPHVDCEGPCAVTRTQGFCRVQGTVRLALKTNLSDIGRVVECCIFMVIAMLGCAGHSCDEPINTGLGPSGLDAANR